MALTKRDTSIVKPEEDDFEDEISDDFDDVVDNTTKFECREVLPEPQVTKHRLDHIMALVDGPYMDLNPDYQREVVWSADRMTKLIDSFIENYYVPPVIFNMFKVPGPDGRGERWQRVCVDGKQRLSSINAFMHGRIPCHDKHGAKWFFCRTPGKSSKRRILPESVREEFKRKMLISFEYTGLNRVQEETLFARVQLGVTLNPAEKMRGTSGPWQDFARMFEDDFRPIMKLIRNEKRSNGFRMYLNCFSQILEVQHPTNPNHIPVLKTQYASLEKFLQNHQALDDSTKSHLATVFTTFNELVLERPSVFADNDYKVVKTFSPLELVGVAVMISVYGDRRNHELLLGDIAYMRKTLRQNHIDLKLNLSCWKSLWEIIDTLEQHRGATDDSQVALNESAPEVLIQPVGSTPQASSSSKKSAKATKKISNKTSTADRSSSKPVKVQAKTTSQAAIHDTATMQETPKVFVSENIAPEISHSKTPRLPTETLREVHSIGIRTNPKIGSNTQDVSSDWQLVNHRTFEPIQKLLQRESALRRRESPSLFVRSTSPDSVIQIDSDSDEDMQDIPPPAGPPLPKLVPNPLDHPESSQFFLAEPTSAPEPRRAAPTAPMRPFSQMVPARITYNAPSPSLKHGSVNHFRAPGHWHLSGPTGISSANLTAPPPETPGVSAPPRHNSKPSPPRSTGVLVPPKPGATGTVPRPELNSITSQPQVNVNMTSRPKPNPGHSNSPIPAEDHIQAQLSQSYLEDSPEEDEVTERERKNLLEQFRTTSTPEVNRARSAEDPEDDDLPVLSRKRRAANDAEAARARALQYKRMR